MFFFLSLCLKLTAEAAEASVGELRFVPSPAEGTTLPPGHTVRRTE